ncbi:DUF2553 family protein [Metabacillus indicus]|uniref:DUF2553 family protein n=1 Tax=Metabacillus indicus TaxID=246786 RepID=UPI003CEB75D5
MSDYHKLDVTDRVVAKLHGEFMELYIGKEYIGKLVITSGGREYELVSGFIMEEDRFYRMYERNCELQQQYAEGCDMGWC